MKYAIRLPEEKRIFHDGDIAVTTRRLIWGDKEYRFAEIESWTCARSDDWKAGVSAAAVGLYIILVGAPWSSLLAILFFGLCLWIWYARKDEIVLWMKSGEEYRLAVQCDRVRFESVVEALRARAEILAREVNSFRRLQTKCWHWTSTPCRYSRWP
jgi:hypothetical protein